MAERKVFIMQNLPQEKKEEGTRSLKSPQKTIIQAVSLPHKHEEQ